MYNVYMYIDMRRLRGAPPCSCSSCMAFTSFSCSREVMCKELHFSLFLQYGGPASPFPAIGMSSVSCSQEVPPAFSVVRRSRGAPPCSCSSCIAFTSFSCVKSGVSYVILPKVMVQYLTRHYSK